MVKVNTRSIPSFEEIDLHNDWTLYVEVDKRGVVLTVGEDVVLIPLVDVQRLLDYIIFESPYIELLNLYHPFDQRQAVTHE